MIDTEVRNMNEKLDKIIKILSENSKEIKGNMEYLIQIAEEIEYRSSNKERFE